MDTSNNGSGTTNDSAPTNGGSEDGWFSWFWKKTSWQSKHGQESSAFVDETVDALFEPIHSSRDEDDPLSDATIRAVYNAVLKRGQWFWNQGLQDGRNGQARRSMQNLAENTSRSIQEKAKVELNGQKQGIQRQVNAQSDRVKAQEDKVDRAEKYWKQVSSYRKNHRRYYSPNLGLFYLLIAIGLIAADIPLAVEVAQQGFGLPGGTDPYTMENLFTQYFFQVIATNWQPIALSVGIAFSAFYVKVFYDEFIGWSLHRFPQQMKDYRSGSGYDFDKEEVKRIRQKAWWRSFAKSVILGITVIALLLIGWLRAVTEIEVGAPESLYAIYPIVTLLLPLIGGVFASIGLSCLQNWWHWRSVRAELNEAKEQLQAENEKQAALSRRHESCEIALGYFKNEAFGNHLESMFAFLYSHGYDRGFVELNPKGTSPIDYAEAVRRKMTSVRFSESAREEAVSN